MKKLSFLIAIALLCLFSQDVNASETDLPIPRFVSLKSDEVNLRTGPGIRYPIKWIYKRQRLPVEIIEEFENWRKIKDSTGESGWVYKGMVEGRRTALVKGEVRTLYQRPDITSKPLVKLEAGVVSNLLSCDEKWCEIEIAGLSGWISRDGIYGVYESEIINSK